MSVPCLFGTRFAQYLAFSIVWLVGIWFAQCFGFPWYGSVGFSNLSASVFGSMPVWYLVSSVLSFFRSMAHLYSLSSVLWFVGCMVLGMLFAQYFGFSAVFLLGIWFA